MNYSKIDRRKFLQMGAVLASAPILLINSLSCSDSSVPIGITNASSFNDHLIKKKIYRVSAPLNKIEGLQSFLIPINTVIPVDPQGNKFCVVRRVQVNDELYLQTVVVERVGIQNDNYLVNGICENDYLFYQPSLVIRELAASNSVLLKQRFLRLVDNI